MSNGLSNRVMALLTHRRERWLRYLMVVAIECGCITSALAETTINDQHTVLSVTGVAEGEEAASVHMLSGEQLLAFPAARLQTTTSISYGSHVFAGPLVRDVLDHFKLTGNMARLEALNGYAIDVPTSDFYNYDVIFAYSLNGQRLTVRHFGPVWVIYPRDDYKELNDLRYDARWVWQLRRVTLFNTDDY
ncbi:molybdopterin-dependent oxidoreductase [Paenalcaligenes niemegkensis]|uniref:molybdopterin-dependent oxidoreductase n=1 Tax=Paenalcaligenes niemegkensis TaxID=2895469 RepID=UPI001EE9A0E5|nr:molybdopterin-dependent oxidoreductase [Paenalcaligenes niemegkensis]MCQ9618059.1 molybdopterin-dependent oxidoreductase [Paenalcaligenes niemegkensis]